jgi:hypothetical protein
MAGALGRVKSKFGLMMDDTRATKLVNHISPSDYARGMGRHGKPAHKQNRLHLAKKHKVARRMNKNA